MQPRSLPTYPYTSSCYVANSYIGKSVHLLLGQTAYICTYICLMHVCMYVSYSTKVGFLENVSNVTSDIFTVCLYNPLFIVCIKRLIRCQCEEYDTDTLCLYHTNKLVISIISFDDYLAFTFTLVCVMTVITYAN